MDHTGKRKWRIVIDFRLLNEKTTGDAYPLPNISEILARKKGKETLETIKRKSLLLSLNLPHAAYSNLTIPKSAPANVPQIERKEESEPKPSKKSLKNSFLLFEKSLKAREDWLDKENIERDAPVLEITAVSEGEDNQELLKAIKELELECETDFDNRIKTAIETAQKLMKKTRKMGKGVNTETKENLSSTDPERRNFWTRDTCNTRHIRKL